MSVKPLDWISWWDARLRMREVWSPWTDLYEAANRAMVNALRSGKVHCRGEFHEFDWRFGNGDSVALQDVISTLRKLHVYSDEAVVEYEITITETTTFGGDLFRVSRPHTRKSERTARARNPELVWSEFRDYLIRFEVPAGATASKKPPSRSKPFWDDAREIAMRWLDDEGCPGPGDGQQAALERVIAQWLTEQGHDAGESTIRRHVAVWISERRTELGIEA